MFRSKRLAAAALVGVLATGGVIGCSHDREPLPGDAVVLSTGKDDLSARVSHPGMVYVYDESDKRVIYTGRVRDGDSVAIDTFRDRVTIDGRTVAQPELDNDHNYKIYFNEDRRSRAASDDTVYRREVKTEQVTPAPAPVQRNPDGTVIRREVTETQVPAAGTTVTPAPAPSDGTVIRRETETEIRRDPAR